MSIDTQSTVQEIRVAWLRRRHESEGQGLFERTPVDCTFQLALGLHYYPPRNVSGRVPVAPAHQHCPTPLWSVSHGIPRYVSFIPCGRKRCRSTGRQRAQPQCRGMGSSALSCLAFPTRRGHSLGVLNTPFWTAADYQRRELPSSSTGSASTMRVWYRISAHRCIIPM